MTALFDILKSEIIAQGPITVACYMEQALGHPEHGYYMKQDPFGKDGDFITSPEISQMFGEMVGLWACVVWQAMGSLSPLNVVELGPGRGTLMADALRATQMVEEFEDAARVWLVETSPALREAQKKALVPTMVMPAWRDRFEDVGEGPLIVWANEFFDALPIRQYVRADDAWRERLVGLNDEGDGLAYVNSADPIDTQVIPEDLRGAPPGSIFEDHGPSRAVMAAIAKRVVEQGGAALFFDYGHNDHAVGETLQAVKSHNYADVLKNPGDQDITAHVDFAQLEQAARDAGAEVLGPVPQGAFLDRLGMRHRADALMLNATPEQIEEIDAAHQRLTAADQMGLLFKVMAIVPPGFGVPPWSE